LTTSWKLNRTPSAWSGKHGAILAKQTPTRLRRGTQRRRGPWPPTPSQGPRLTCEVSHRLDESDIDKTMDATGSHRTTQSVRLRLYIADARPAVQETTPTMMPATQHILSLVPACDDMHGGLDAMCRRCMDASFLNFEANIRGGLKRARSMR